MNKRYPLYVLFFMIFIFSDNSWAHHPAVGAGTGETGSIRTIPATTLQKGRGALSLQTEYIKFDAFSDTELLGFAGSGKDVHSVDYVIHTLFNVSYGITDDFTLSLKIPYEYLNNIREVHQDEPEEIHNRGNSKGIGDLTLFGFYRFLKMPHDGFESSLIFGLKMPTGKTTVKDRSGERFDTEFQPGSGSWDPMIGIAATKRFGPLSLDANILYTIANKGSQNTDLGDLLNYNVAFSYRIVEKKISWDLIIEANGEWKQKQKINGVKDENSGESILLLSPGTRVTWNKQWSAYLSIGVPIIQHVNGIQTDTNFRALFGIVVGF